MIAVQRLFAVAFFVSFDRLLATVGVGGLPPPLVGMGIMFFSLLALDAVGGPADKIYRLLEPGYRFLLKWAPMFFIPALVRLPLQEDRFTLGEFCRIGVMVLLGGLFQFVSVAFVASALGKTAPEEKTLPQVSHSVASMGVVDSNDDEPYPRPGRPYKRRWLPIYLLGMVTAYALSRSDQWPMTAETSFIILASLVAFVAGTAAPKVVRDMIHPMFFGTFGAWLAIDVWSRHASNAGTFTDVLVRYSAKDGAGGRLAMLLGPLVIALALLLFERRSLLKRDSVPILGTAVAASFSGMFGSALIARLLGVPKVIAVASVSRYCTAPLALAVATSLHASVPIALLLVVASGFLGVFLMKPVLGFLGINAPRERGLSVGAVSHVLGTVALASWDEAAVPYSALIFVLASSLSAALAACGPIKAALLWLLGV